MPEGYGYVRDQQPLFVDWAEVSKSFTDRLKENEEERKTTEKGITDNRKEFTQTLQDLPVGQNEVLNEKISTFAQQAMDYSLGNFNRFKSRGSNLQQYNAFENNLNSGTELLFHAIKNFNEKFDTFAERALTGKASKVEVFIHELMQNYTDWSKVSVDINPQTGSIVISELDENGKLTDKRIDVSQLGYFSNFTQDTYDVNAEISNIAQGLGEKFLEAADGLSLTYQGLMYNEIISNTKIIEDLKPEVQSLIDQDYELNSVLTDWMNVDITTDKTETEKLYYNQDTGKLEPTKDQKDKAFDFVEDKLLKALTIKKQAAAPKDTSRETLDLINTIRLSGGTVPPQLFEQLLLDKGLTKADIDKVFPEGMDAEVYKEFHTDLMNFVTGITPETLNSAVNEDKPMALNRELALLRQIGIKAEFVAPTRAQKRAAAKAEKSPPLGYITINMLGGEDDEEYSIKLVKGMGLLELYDEIVTQIPVYQAPKDIASRLELIAAAAEARKGRGPGDSLFD